MNSPVSPVLNTGALSRSTALYKLSIAADSGPAGSVLAASILLACNGIVPLMQLQLDIHYSAQVSKQTVCRKPPPRDSYPREKVCKWETSPGVLQLHQKGAKEISKPPC